MDTHINNISMLIDIHTHKQKTDCNCFYILNCEMDQVGELEQATALSVGIHPWKINECSRARLADMARTMNEKNVVAVGEIGLDKLTTADMEVQKTVFTAQMKMAAIANKPVIIHCVKAVEELQNCIKTCQILPPAMLIHGFRGKPEQAMQLVRNGFMLSFGVKHNTESLLAIPRDSFLLETDDSDTKIADVYRNVATELGCSIEELETEMEKNCDRFLSAVNIDYMSQK